MLEPMTHGLRGSASAPPAHADPTAPGGLPNLPPADVLARLAARARSVVRDGFPCERVALFFHVREGVLYDLPGSGVAAQELAWIDHPAAVARMRWAACEVEP